MKSVTRSVAALLVAGALLAACGGVAQAPLTVGAVYPLSGPQAEGGRQELGGVKAALSLAGGRPVNLETRSVETPEQARAAVDQLIDQDHVPIILGTYGSTLAEAAASEADRRHVVYWETGAVADLVTQRRNYVFRTVATGGELGRTAVQFTADELLPRDGLRPGAVRAVIVNVDDIYGRSVADSEQKLAGQVGIPVVDRIRYDPITLDAGEIARRIAADRADYLWDVSYIDDGIAIWSSVVESGVRLRAAIGTSSAFCMAEFGRRLGAEAVGVYAADKPDDQVNPNALSPRARALLARARAAYAAEGLGSDMSLSGVAGFVGGWTLFHDLLPGVRGSVTPDAVRAAAYRLNEPMGSSINGGGVLFAGPGEPNAGQNLRAPSTVGQWQAVNVMRTVYPAGFAEAAPISS
jgi:branched-chain amino acid transport system substrate-binding protein